MGLKTHGFLDMRTQVTGVLIKACPLPTLVLNGLELSLKLRLDWGQYPRLLYVLDAPSVVGRRGSELVRPLVLFVLYFEPSFQKTGSLFSSVRPWWPEGWVHG